MAHIRNCLKHHSQEIGSRIINSIDNFDVFVVVTVQLFDIYNFRQQQLEKFPFFFISSSTMTESCRQTFPCQVIRVKHVKSPFNIKAVYLPPPHTPGNCLSVNRQSQLG